MLIKNLKMPSSPLEMVLYTILTPPTTLPTTPQAIERLCENITLKAQGEAVEISEEYPTPVLMMVFDIVHKISPELVLRLKSGRRVLIFNHWGKPVLRDKDIYDEFSTIVQHIQSDKVQKFVPELTLNIENIWEKIKTNEEDNLKATKKALTEIKNQIKPAMVTTLIGKSPALLFLLTQHLLYGKTGEIWYQENLSTTPIKITRQQ